MHQTQQTSVAAHESIKSQKPILQTVVLKALQEVPNGLTDEQIRLRTGLHTQSAIARRNELVHLGKVMDSGERRMSMSGRKAIVWVALKNAA